jgi:hypothetical protein
MQYLVHTPSRDGTKEADDLTAAIALAFQAGQALTGDTLAVILERTERSPYTVADLGEEASGGVWTFKTVTTRWRVFTPTTT